MLHGFVDTGGLVALFLLEFTPSLWEVQLGKRARATEAHNKNSMYCHEIRMLFFLILLYVILEQPNKDDLLAVNARQEHRGATPKVIQH